MTIVKAINSTNEDLSNVGELIKDIRMRARISKPGNALMRRHGNRTTHMLAWRALQSDEFKVWVEDGPEYILPIVHQEGRPV